MQQQASKAPGQAQNQSEEDLDKIFLQLQLDAGEFERKSKEILSAIFERDCKTEAAAAGPDLSGPEKDMYLETYAVCESDVPTIHVTLQR